jgi:hypothetical protein
MTEGGETPMPFSLSKRPKEMIAPARESLDTVERHTLVLCVMNSVTYS